MPVANDLKGFFQGKVEKIYSDITAKLESTVSDLTTSPASPTLSSVNYFKFMTEDSIADVIKEMGSKSCEMDPIPTWLFKNCLAELLPIVTLITNMSLQTGIFPDGLKCAVVRPTLKKFNLDSDDLKNYRPISNLTFLSKVIEKCVHKQLTEYVTASGLFADFQSGYRKAHSCETAVLKIHNDVLLMLDQKSHVVLMLLDLSAAFDTINHDLLVNRLKKSYGLDGYIIKWIQSYLKNRSFKVVVNGKKSDSSSLNIGVPQGSILDPLLFILYTKDLEEIAMKYGFMIHLYADDSQIYFSLNHQEGGDSDCQLQKLKLCFIEIKRWMSNNYLKMNDTKTEIMEIHGYRPLAPLQSLFLLDTDCDIEPSTSAKNLGFYFDPKLNLDSQINKVTQKCYTNLRNIGRLGSKLTMDLKIQLVHSTVLSILDNGNATYGGLTATQLNSLQKVQNAAVRFIYGLYGKERRQHISPYLKELHFLPVCYRIYYKIALLTFKSLNNLAPNYISDMITPRKVSSYGSRKNDDPFLLVVPPTPRYSKTYGAFTYTAPSVWNSLPYGIRCMSDINKFKAALKTHYFRLAFKDSTEAYDDIDI